MRIDRAEEMATRPIPEFAGRGASVTHLARGDSISVVRIEPHACVSEYRHQRTGDAEKETVAGSTARAADAG
jgi:hypothetical protein